MTFKSTHFLLQINSIGIQLYGIVLTATASETDDTLIDP